MDPNYVAVRNVLMTLMLQVLADEKRRDYVDPFAIPPFKGNRKQEEKEGGKGEGKGKGRDMASMNGGAIHLTKSGFAVNSGPGSSSESLSAGTAFVPSTRQTTPTNELPGAPLLSHISNKNVTSGAYLKEAEEVGSCSQCAHCMGKGRTEAH